ncbi:LOW QUALITY PROTEIN: leucine-rich repeat and immunoglobulin-like domain-containing nogo receptor-interacting protein 2 [Menidia menidia]
MLRPSPGLGALLLGGFLLLAGPARGCPPRCDCSAQTKSVSCHRRRLPGVPEGVPIETRLLDLSKNRLRLVTPDNFSSFTQLETLDLSDNLIGGVEPGSFRAQLALRSLTLRSNLLQLLPAGALAGLGNLTHLDLSHNRLVLLLDHAFQDLRRLSSLQLGDNQLVFVSPRAFSGLPALRSLALERCNLTAVPSEALAQLPGLEALRLRHLGVALLKPFSFRRLPRLRHLELDAWPQLQALPRGALAGLNLSTLSVTRTNLSAFPGEALRGQLHLTHLNLSHCALGRLRRGDLPALPRLQELRLQGAGLLALEPAALGGLAALLTLDLSHNALDSLERGVLAAPGALRRLCLGGNPLQCDCRLLWLLGGRRPAGLLLPDAPRCSGPPPLAGAALRELAEPLASRHMTCTRPRFGPDGGQLLLAEEGRPARLRCGAEGAPPPAVVWLTPHRRYVTARSSGRLRLRPDGSLEITAAELHDSGVYQCVASNAAGNASRSASLAVRGAAPGEGGGARGGGGAPPHANRSAAPEANGTLRFNATLRFNGTAPIAMTTILISTAMGCLSFLGVVVFCFLLLFAWSRGKGRHRSHCDIQYVPRKSTGAAAEPESSGPRRVNMKMI